MAIKIGINGFGRIGRNIVREAMDQKDMEIVAINDVTDAKTLAHLLKYDSVHGIYDKDITAKEKSIAIGEKEIQVFSVRDPGQIPWKDLGIDIVMECTGLFVDYDSAKKHIDSGAKKVIISAPAKKPDITIVMGVNENSYDSAKHHIISNASCTTNCLAPVAKVVNDNFKIQKGFMTTIHAYTNDQRILDLPHKDLRRARAAALSMIPTTTGAAAAVALVLPELTGKLDGIAIRVPTPNVSLVDLVALVDKKITKENVNTALREASLSFLKGILAYSEEPLVSIDFNSTTYSSTVDGLSTSIIGDNMVKILAWYDNEFGFSARMLDLARHIGQNI